jgi:hypothetical protein
LSAAACLFSWFRVRPGWRFAASCLGDHRVVDFTSYLGLAQSTVSAHLVFANAAFWSHGRSGGCRCSRCVMISRSSRSWPRRSDCWRRPATQWRSAPIRRAGHPVTTTVAPACHRRSVAGRLSGSSAGRCERHLQPHRSCSRGDGRRGGWVDRADRLRSVIAGGDEQRIGDLVAVPPYGAG